MNIRAKPAEAPIAVPHPTIPDRWTVPHQGQERTITRSGNMFTAEFCGVLPTQIFQRAINVCVADIEFQNSRTVTLPVPASEAERWLLDFSDADNASERRARP